MQALVIDADGPRMDGTLLALIEAGFVATGTTNLQVAETCLCRQSVDVLIIDRETAGDAFGDTLGFAEDCNAQLVSVLRTANVLPDFDTLPEHFPSLHYILDRDVSADVAAQLALASRAGRPPANADWRSAARLTGPDATAGGEEMFGPWRTRFRELEEGAFAKAS